MPAAPYICLGFLNICLENAGKCFESDIGSTHLVLLYVEFRRQGELFGQMSWSIEYYDLCFLCTFSSICNENRDLGKCDTHLIMYRFVPKDGTYINQKIKITRVIWVPALLGNTSALFAIHISSTTISWLYSKTRQAHSSKSESTRH